MGKERGIFGAAAAGLVLVALSGCGGGSDHGSSHGSAAEPSGTVGVTMRDIAYEPGALSVKPGETVKFVFHNEGKIRHDAFLGDEAAQADHEKQMQGEGSMGGSGGMDGHHDTDAIKVEPGMTGSLTHTFEPGDTLVIGCHEPGHYAA